MGWRTASRGRAAQIPSEQKELALAVIAGACSLDEPALSIKFDVAHPLCRDDMHARDACRAGDFREAFHQPLPDPITPPGCGKVDVEVSREASRHGGESPKISDVVELSERRWIDEAADQIAREDFLARTRPGYCQQSEFRPVFQIAA